MPSPLKILYISAFPPNNKSGGQTFSLNCIKSLSKSCTVDLIYFSYPSHDCTANAINNFSAASSSLERKKKNAEVFRALYDKSHLDKQLLHLITKGEEK